MKIQQMRQILAVSNSESINKAAQKLYMSQSALSASIHSAEQELGQPILKRSHNGIEMTDFGKQFVETSRKILELYDELLRETAPESNQLWRYPANSSRVWTMFFCSAVRRLMAGGTAALQRRCRVLFVRMWSLEFPRWGSL